MQRKDDKDKGNDEGRKDGGKTEDVIDEGDDEGGTATATSDLEEAVRVMPLIVPTKMEDGGGNEQQQAQPATGSAFAQPRPRSWRNSCLCL
eukprot:scaffold5441_cov167-Skeletonema_menzelii.AAC.2